MAKEKTAPEAEETAALDATPKFTIEKLRQNCLRLFGVTVSTFDGATYGLTGEYTVKEASDIIAKWKAKEAK